jgi:hypothetical protein
MHELQTKMLRADRSTGTEPPEQEHDAGFTDTGQLVALCDGVFAIIVTLLVPEIHRPSAEPGSLVQELLKEWPSYIAYGVAFLYVGVIWLNHHYLFERRRNGHLDENCQAFVLRTSPIEFESKDRSVATTVRRHDRPTAPTTK